MRCNLDFAAAEMGIVVNNSFARVYYDKKAGVEDRQALGSPCSTPASCGAFYHPDPGETHWGGAGFDIATANHDPEAFEAVAREVGFLGFGFHPRFGFMLSNLPVRKEQRGCAMADDPWSHPPRLAAARLSRPNTW
jgi:hypothetical protein